MPTEHAGVEDKMVSTTERNTSTYTYAKQTYSGLIVDVPVFSWPSSILRCEPPSTTTTLAFLTRDPIGYVDGRNIFQYVGAKVLGFVDPLGLEGSLGGGDTDQWSCCRGTRYKTKSKCCTASGAVLKRSCEECCRTYYWDNKKDLDTMGFVVCCDEQWCPCTTRYREPDSLGNNIIFDCVVAHENSHGRDHQSRKESCGCRMPIIIGRSINKEDRCATECKAYGIEADCLYWAARRCNGDPSCEIDIARRKRFVDDQIQAYCNTANCLANPSL